jgi:hypothetical protein
VSGLALLYQQLLLATNRPLCRSCSARPPTALSVRCPSQTPSALDPHQRATLCPPCGPHHATCWPASSPAPRQRRSLRCCVAAPRLHDDAQKVNYNMILECIPESDHALAIAMKACVRAGYRSTSIRRSSMHGAASVSARAGHGANLPLLARSSSLAQPRKWREGSGGTWMRA